MTTPLENKSSADKIRDRFDNDVERFSNLETGQSATIDAPIMMELITQAAIASTNSIQHILDIGCGAANNTIKLRQTLEQDFEVTLVDLSQRMLDRAVERLEEANKGKITTHAVDFRTVELEDETFDVVLAAAVLHHFRDDDDWRAAFNKIYRVLKPGGSVWISDMVSHNTEAIQQLMWDRYGRYLAALGGETYRDIVFAYIDEEDSPRSVGYQLDLLRSVGFKDIEVLHKNACFAAFGAVK